MVQSNVPSTLYVNPNSGNDGAIGSQSAPFKTLTYALQQAQTGITIQLTPGIYDVANGETFPLVISSGVIVVGDEANKGSGILIEGSGEYISFTFALQNITFLLETDAQLRGVTVTNRATRGTAVWIESTEPIVVKNTFTNCDREGVFATGTAKPKIFDNVFAQNKGNGLAIVRSTQGEVRRNIFRNTGYGITIEDESTPLITDNQIFGNRSGIVISGKAQPIIRDNLIEKNTEDGLVVISQALPDLGNSQDLGGNVFRDNGQYDLHNTTSVTLISVGNQLEPTRVKGLVDIRNGQVPSPPTTPTPEFFTFRGSWRITVTGKETQNNQRFIISGSDSRDGVHPGIVGYSIDISGRAWKIQIQYNDGTGWKDSLIRRADRADRGTSIEWIIESENDMESEENDWNDLVLKVETINIFGQRFSRSESFIKSSQLNPIYRALEAAAGDDEIKKEANKAILEKLISETSELDLLYSYSRDFLRGNLESGRRLIVQLNYIVQREGIQDISVSVTRPAGAASSQVLGIAFPGFPRRSLCLISPPKIADIFLGVLKLCEGDPRGSGGNCPAYLTAVDRLVERNTRLEILNNLAVDILEGQDHTALKSFDATLNLMGRSSIKENQLATNLFNFSFGNPDGIPISLEPPRLLLDPCRAERWQETADAVLCFRRLRSAPRYEIEEIINITRTTDSEPIIRRGCPGDLIEIQGSNFGLTGEVLFPRVRGSIRASIERWEENRIQFIVPEGAVSGEGDLSICINPRIEECVRFPSVCRLAASGTDHSFEVVLPPMIEQFSANGLTVEELDDSQVRAEACTNISLNVRTIRAERVRIREITIDDSDDSGRVIWDSGEGVPRLINTAEIDETPTVNLQESKIYILQVRNLCETLERRITVNIYYAIHLTISASRIRFGSSVDLNVRISCPSPLEGIPVRLRSSDPVALSVPDEPVVIPEGETQLTVTLISADPCAEVDITGESPGYEPGTADVLVTDVPEIINVSPLEVSACSSFILEVRGNCFDAEANGNLVQVNNSSRRITLEVNGIRFTNPDNRVQNAILEVRGEGLPPGSWQVFVTSHAQISEAFRSPLIVRPVPANIRNFTASPSLITPCVSTSVRLEWEVESAERVRITSGGREIFSQFYGESCGRRSGNHLVTVEAAQTFTLEAYPLGEGAPFSLSVMVSERVVPSASEVILINATPPDLISDTHTLTVWKYDRNTGITSKEGTISFGERLSIEFTNCHVQDLIAISHELIDDYNRRFRTSYSPDSWLTTQTVNFQKWTSPREGVLGRDGFAPCILRTDQTIWTC